MSRAMAAIVAFLFAMVCVSSAQNVRGSETAVPAVTAVEVSTDKAQAVALSEHVEPPNWKYQSDVKDPLFAFMALLFVPLCGIPCLVKCKNGDLNKVWSAN